MSAKKKESKHVPVGPWTAQSDDCDDNARVVGVDSCTSIFIGSRICTCHGIHDAMALARKIAAALNEYERNGKR